MKDKIHEEFDNFTKFLFQTDGSDLPSYRDELYNKIEHISKIIETAPNRDELFDQFYKLFAPFDQGPIHKRARNKPLGYAGDYLLIDWIYTQKKAKSGKGNFFDALFHSYQAAQSVRNRKQYFINKCIELSHEKPSRFDVLNIGCGSCRDVLETLQSCNNGNHLFFHCVDQEPAAIEYAKKLLAHVEIQNNVYLDCTNIFRLKTLNTYDLIWSAGLFDYLENRIAVLLLKKIWRYLKDDGQIIFGNFSPENPTRRGMELGCRWYLIHRTADELITLCKKAELPFSEIEVESEPMGINLFCIIKK